MYEVGELKNLGLLVGTGRCNAKCAHCGGLPHRRYTPNEDGIFDADLITRTLKECYARGARSLSISSSGEPTLSPKTVTGVLSIVDDLRRNGTQYDRVNLYSNGILIGEDKGFCERHLTVWKDKGLTSVYVTVHSACMDENAEIYGVASYPPLETVISRIHDAGLLMRANLMLMKNTIPNYEKFASTVDYILEAGADSISAWQIRDIDDQIDHSLSPSDAELDKMSGDGRVRVIRESNDAVYTSGQKVTLFPDGRLSSTWCK